MVLPLIAIIRPAIGLFPWLDGSPTTSWIKKIQCNGRTLRKQAHALTKWAWRTSWLGKCPGKERRRIEDLVTVCVFSTWCFWLLRLLLLSSLFMVLEREAGRWNMDYTLLLSRLPARQRTMENHHEYGMLLTSLILHSRLALSSWPLKFKVSPTKSSVQNALRSAIVAGMRAVRILDSSM